MSTRRKRTYTSLAALLFALTATSSLAANRRPGAGQGQRPSSTPETTPARPAEQTREPTRREGIERRPGLLRNRDRSPIDRLRPDRDRRDRDRQRSSDRYRHLYLRSPLYYSPGFYDPFYRYPYYGSGLYPYGYGVYGSRVYPYSSVPGYGVDLSPTLRDRTDVWPDADRGNVSLRISPRDVSVYVDGALVGKDGRATLNLPSGRWRLEFVRPGYRPESVDLEIEQGVAVRVERQLERIRNGETQELREIPLGETGELRIEITPPDAIVYLNGRAVGLARHAGDLPSLQDLPPGRYKVEARYPGHESLEQEIVISPVQPAVVRAELKPEE